IRALLRWISQPQDHFVTGQLTFQAHAPRDQPNRRIKPMKRLRETDRAIDPKITAFQMGQFMQENMAELSGRELGGDWGRQQKPRLKAPEKARRLDAARFEDAWIPDGA